MAHDELLLRVAESIANGEPVDWDAESSGEEKVKLRLRQLRAIEGIAAVHAASTSLDEVTHPIPQSGTVAESDHDTWGSLRIVRRLGEGSYGEVFLAHDPALQKDVALKLLRRDPRRTRRDEMLREARQLARVRHPNVLEVYGADESDGRVGLWTELVDGRTLEEILASQGPLGPREATLVGIDLVRALAAVHAVGLVHRDVKTANIMRERGGRIVLMDFSAAIERRRLEESRVGRFVGTWLFMAPELLAGGTASAASDIYSLGVVLYRVVTGQYPIDARNPVELREKHRADAATPLRDARADLPTVFVQVVERAIAADPTRRYASFGAMERDLVAALDALPARGAATNRRERAPLLPRWRWAAVAASVATAVAVVWFLFGPSPLPPPQASLFRLVQGEEHRLQPGGRLGVGDRLFLEVEGAADFHVYVFNEDTVGKSYLLFPLEELDLRNPLPAGRRHRLPGTVDGKPLYWEVTNVGGEENLFVVAAPEPLKGLEREIARLPAAGQGAPIELGPAPILRGIGGLAPGAAPPDDNAPSLSDLFGRISAEGLHERGIWTWTIRLRNPQ